MPETTVNPLSSTQIEAAAELRASHAPLWRESGDALEAMASGFPDFGRQSALLKAAALRQLYNAGPYSASAFESMVNRIVEVMAAPPVTPILTVDAIAALPEGTYWVFASKFVHFFVEAYEPVPMLDRKWVTRRMNYHFRPAEMTYQYPTYSAFYDDAVALRESIDVGTPPSFRTLDHYLWLAGMYAEWPALPFGIHPEFVTLFGAPPPAASPLLSALLDE